MLDLKLSISTHDAGLAPVASKLGDIPLSPPHVSPVSYFVACFSAPTLVTVHLMSPLTLVCWPGAWSWLLSRGILTCPLGFLLSRPSGPVSTLSAALKSKPCQVNCNNQIQKPHTEYSLTAHLIELLIEFYLYSSPVPAGEANTIDIEN